MPLQSHFLNSEHLPHWSLVSYRVTKFPLISELLHCLFPLPGQLSHPRMHPSIHLASPIHPPIHHPSIYLHPCIHPAIHPPIHHLSIHLTASIHPPIHPPIHHLSTHPHPFTHPVIHPSTNHPSTQSHAFHLLHTHTPVSLLILHISAKTSQMKALPHSAHPQHLYISYIALSQP